jgi:trehalose-phosphatase
VNPYNKELVASVLHQALAMDASERTARMRALQRRERRNDVHAWVDTLLRKARAPLESIRPLGPQDLAAWLDAAIEGQRLALFFDYDGTLAEITAHPKDAHMRASMREALAASVRRGDVDVTIVSGRALADVRGLVDVPGLCWIGNHGLEIEGPGLSPFAHPDLPHFSARLHDLAAELAGLGEPGVWVEEKGASLTLHYRAADRARHEEIVQRARDIVRQAGFQARDAICAVEARPPTGWDKGHAVLHVLRALHGPEWASSIEAVYVGDDDTDEDAFRALEGLGVTFRVGRAERATMASHRLPNVDAVETLLRWVAER